jgi:hypothetical protein
LALITLAVRTFDLAKHGLIDLLAILIGVFDVDVLKYLTFLIAIFARDPNLISIGHTDDFLS